MRPSLRALLLSTLCATILAGPFALNVTSERGSVFVLIYWLLLAIAFFRGFMRLEILWFMDRDWTAKRAGMYPPPVHISPPPPPPPPPRSPRRPMPKVFKIVGLGVGALLASFVVPFVSLTVYFLFNPTPEMLAKAETRRVDAEIQRIETNEKRAARR